MSFSTIRAKKSRVAGWDNVSQYLGSWSARFHEQISLVVITCVEDANFNIGTVFGKRCIHFISPWDFDDLFPSPDPIFFYGLDVFRCITRWELRAFIINGFYGLTATYVKAIYEHIPWNFYNFMHRSSVDFIRIKKKSYPSVITDFKAVRTVLVLQLKANSWWLW